MPKRTRVELQPPQPQGAGLGGLLIERCFFNILLDVFLTRREHFGLMLCSKAGNVYFTPRRDLFWMLRRLQARRIFPLIFNQRLPIARTLGIVFHL